MDELVDVVDDDNNVLYTVSKQEAHAKGLPHRTVISTIFDSQGNWVLVKQAGHKQDAGQLVSPVGGHVTAGETEEEALRREAFEETGVQNFDYKRIARISFDREVVGRKELHRFAVFEIYSDDPIVLNDESVEYQKFTEAELKHALKTRPDDFGVTFHISVDNFYPHLRR